MALPAPSVQADALEEGFKSLVESAATAINEPGQYRSQSRNIMVAGGMDIRFPRRSMPALVSVTPMNLRFGCGGISAHFGGFSFVNGEEIKNLIQAIAQNALGMAIELVITTLCGVCAHVMQVMRTLAKDAARLSIDSCAVAQGLMDGLGETQFGTWLEGQRSSASSKWGAFCSEKGMTTGGFSDYFAGMSNSCNEAVKALENFQERASEAIDAIPGLSAEDKNRVTCKLEAGACNLMWNALQSGGLKGNSDAQIAAKLILMNISGTTLRLRAEDVPPGPDGKPGSPDLPREPRLGMVIDGGGEGGTMDDVFALFMCGTNFSAEIARESRSYEAYCSRPTVEVTDGPAPADGMGTKLGHMEVWDCGGEDVVEADRERYKTCSEMRKVPLNSIQVLRNNLGYIPLVFDIFKGGLTSIRTNQPLSPDMIGLINITPIPIYQALNVSAVYPEAGYDLIDTLTAIVAQMMAYRHVADMIKSAATVDAEYLDEGQINNLFVFLGNVKAASVHRQSLVAQNLVLQEQLIQQIRALNMAMQKQVMTDELLGAQQFGSSLNTAVRN